MARKFKQTTRTLAMEEALSEAVSDLQTLQEEMESWRDNMDDNEMSHLPKYDEVNAAEEQLSTAVQILEEAPEELNSYDINLRAPIIFIDSSPYGKRSPSRSMRRDNIVAILEAVKEEVLSQVEDVRDHIDDFDDDDEAELSAKEQEKRAVQRDKEAEQAEDAEIAAEETIGTSISEVEAVEFPGMF